MEKQVDFPNYYIPLVFKSKLSLVHHLTVMKQYMKVFGSCDSYTYFDILPNGKKMSECTREELLEIVDAHTDVLRFFNGKTHIENDVYKKQPVLEVVCPHCGLVTWFNEIEDIPEENFVCPCCEKVSIYYGGEELEDQKDFDKNMKIVKGIIKELTIKLCPDIDADKVFGN